MTFWVAAAVVVVALLVLLLGLWAYSTAHRLDRLHVRSDRSWQSSRPPLPVGRW